MVWRLLALLAVAGFTACAAPQSLNPVQAQADTEAAWQIPQHVLWELDWPAAPVGGVVVAETWRAGPRYRYEILEAAAPALVGEVLVSDGRRVVRYNRFENTPHVESDSAHLPPVTEALALVDRLVAELPRVAIVEPAQLPAGPAEKISLTYANDDALIFWRDSQTGLPARITLTAGPGQSFTLTARRLELLPNPPEALFGVVR